MHCSASNARIENLFNPCNLWSINYAALDQNKMKIVLQRVSEASVTVDGQKTADIQKGLLVLVGIEDADTQEDIDWLAGKIIKMRIFGDENDVMNCSVQDIDGEIIVVSQFTLHASTKKGNRPSYIKASKPEFAIPMYENFVKALEKEFDKKIQTGIFGADMKVSLLNDGPVTILIDSKNRE
ncbi:D-tyrosyl-tRNA(Tyr) deacylase [Flavobacterium panici]|uniref:D-aminoacyl-tRNA deacylase n=2 Tax=Flavobacterium panici TaxID=2654843 RepID=A0A9N8J0Z5_9FLAO|nr:D-tyrosyl-tRNA(Tyr) deacylase [Flavobacterium panici]